MDWFEERAIIYATSVREIMDEWERREKIRLLDNLEWIKQQREKLDELK